MEDGEWRMVNGGWWMLDGGWCMGGWKIGKLEDWETERRGKSRIGI